MDNLLFACKKTCTAFIIMFALMLSLSACASKTIEKDVNISELQDEQIDLSIMAGMVSCYTYSQQENTAPDVTLHNGEFAIYDLGVMDTDDRINVKYYLDSGEEDDNSSTMFILTDYDKKSFQIDKQYPSKFLTFDMTKNEKASLNFSVEEKSNVALIMVGNTANKYKVCDFVVNNSRDNTKEKP